MSVDGTADSGAHEAPKPASDGAIPTVRVHLVRHGAGDGTDGRCIGHTDVALSARGADDIRAVADALAILRPTLVVASDLRRAQQSAAVLTDAWARSSAHPHASIAASVRVDARLREMHFGNWDGRSWDEIDATDGARLATWMADWQQASTPDGEGFGDVIARIADWLAATIADARAMAIHDLVVVAHAGSIRALLVHALGLPRSAAFKLRIDHAGVTSLAISGTLTPNVCTGAELLTLNARVPYHDG